LSAWATSQTQQEGGFYRLRPTGQPARLPVGWHVTPEGLELTFSDSLAPAAARDTARHVVKVWGLKRSANYGSPRLGERALSVTRAELLPDLRTIRLTVPELAPTDVVEITSRLQDAAGREVQRVITGTIHRVPGGLQR
jgi:hypothetical protein